MHEWLLTWGTQHQFTAPYKSAQNSRIEWLHQTLMGKACTMCTSCNVPPNWWDEFVLTACYLSNRTPVTSQAGHTPFERWFSHKPDPSHLCEIGSHTFILIQNWHNPKIYNRSIECVLIGYSLDLVDAPGSPLSLSYSMVHAFNLYLLATFDCYPKCTHWGISYSKVNPQDGG
jgi:hypothetical protein